MSIIIDNNKIKKIYINNNNNNNNSEIQKGYIGINSQAKLFYENNNQKLPDGYIKIKYIQKNDTTSYINTGILGIKPMKIQAGTNNIGSGVKEIFGFLSTNPLSSNGKPYISAAYFYDQYLYYYYYDQDENILDNKIYIEKNNFYDIGYNLNQNLHTFTFKDPNNESVKEISVNYNQESYFINNENPLLLFGYYNTTSHSIISGNSGLMIKKVEIYDDLQVNLLRNFIPCISSNLEIGLYDLVTKEFYGNSGTGGFSPGPRDL